MLGIEPAGQGLIVLDAAIGTRLIAQGLDLLQDDPALWVLERPEAIVDLHRRDLRAGAQAVLTCTFGANRALLGQFGREADLASINRQAVTLARTAIDSHPGCLVLGSIGPTAEGDDLREQVEVLLAEGVDGLVLETQRVIPAETALITLRKWTSAPIVASLFDWPDIDAVDRLEAAGASAIGVNCVVGMAEAVRIAKAVRTRTALALWIKPSAGLPGGPLETPSDFARWGPELLGLGPILVGGCCGTTEDHIAALARVLHPA